jgi:hypothetical protein
MENASQFQRNAAATLAPALAPAGPSAIVANEQPRSVSHTPVDENHQTLLRNLGEKLQAMSGSEIAEMLTPDDITQFTRLANKIDSHQPLPPSRAVEAAQPSQARPTFLEGRITAANAVRQRERAAIPCLRCRDNKLGVEVLIASMLVLAHQLHLRLDLSKDSQSGRGHLQFNCTCARWTMETSPFGR